MTLSSTTWWWTPILQQWPFWNHFYPSLTWYCHSQPYANYGNGHTIHSSSQLRTVGTLAHDAPHSNGGLQCLITSNGYPIPLCYQSGLPYYMAVHPPTDDEMDTLPHIILTGNHTWNPTCINDEFSIVPWCPWRYWWPRSSSQSYQKKHW